MPAQRPARRHRRAAAALTAPLVLGYLFTAAFGNALTVKRGDTLSEIAKRYHTSVAALRALNDIPGNGAIFAGQSLRLPGRAIDSKPAPRTTVVTRYHTVIPGDTLTALAARYKTSVSWLQARNHLPRSRVIVVGARLDVGSAPAPAATRAGVPRTPRPHAVVRSRIKELIRREAVRARIDPALALALAWQESGFQQDVVSHAGAIGAMQVMPDTGRWMSANVVGRRLDLSDVEDNIVAGVGFLAVLLRMTGRTPAALAGYYQGLASVKAHGEYTDTKAYVRNILFLQRRFRRG